MEQKMFQWEEKVLSLWHIMVLNCQVRPFVVLYGFMWSYTYDLLWPCMVFCSLCGLVICNIVALLPYLAVIDPNSFV